MKRQSFELWHAISVLGGILFINGVAISTLAPNAQNPRAVTTSLLITAALATIAVSLAVRHWVGARIVFWMGGLRLVGAMSINVMQTPGEVDYRHFLVTMMILIAVLEFLTAAKLRQASEHSRPIQLSAVAGVMASAGLLHSYPVISDMRMSVLLGLSMVISGLAFIGLSFAYRRGYRAARAALRSVGGESDTRDFLTVANDTSY